MISKKTMSYNERLYGDQTRSESKTAKVLTPRVERLRTNLENDCKSHNSPLAKGRSPAGKQVFPSMCLQNLRIQNINSNEIKERLIEILNNVCIRFSRFKIIETVLNKINDENYDFERSPEIIEAEIRPIVAKEFGTIALKFIYVNKTKKEGQYICLVTSSKGITEFNQHKLKYLIAELQSKNPLRRPCEYILSNRISEEYAYQLVEETCTKSIDANITINHELNKRFIEIVNQKQNLCKEFMQILNGTYTGNTNEDSMEDVKQEDIERAIKLKASIILKKYTESNELTEEKKVTAILNITHSLKLYLVNALCGERNNFYIMAKLIGTYGEGTVSQLFDANQIRLDFAFSAKKRKKINKNPKEPFKTKELCCSCKHMSNVLTPDTRHNQLYRYNLRTHLNKSVTADMADTGYSGSGTGLGHTKTLEIDEKDLPKPRRLEYDFFNEKDSRTIHASSLCFQKMDFSS